MTSQEKQKLNEKLARWAGFHQTQTSVGTWWHTPNGKSIPNNKRLPVFTDSLDACFKWLVPKLVQMPNLHIIDYQYIGCCQEIKLLRHGWLIVLADDEADYSANDDYPALTFCLAIEKLIDRKVME